MKKTRIVGVLIIGILCDSFQSNATAQLSPNPKDPSVHFFQQRLSTTLGQSHSVLTQNGLWFERLAHNHGGGGHT